MPLPSYLTVPDLTLALHHLSQPLPLRLRKLHNERSGESQKGVQDALAQHFQKLFLLWLGN